MNFVKKKLMKRKSNTKLAYFFYLSRNKIKIKNLKNIFFSIYKKIKFKMFSLKPFLNKAIIPVLILILNSFLLGYSISFPSTTISDLNTYFKFSTSESSLFSAITSLTAILGPLYNKFFNKKGNRFTVQMISLLGLISWTILLVAPKNCVFLGILHRILLGISIGSISALVPGYIMEITPDEFKNVYGVLHQFGITVGIFLVNLLGIFYKWNVLALISTIISGLIILLMNHVPDTHKSNKKNDFNVGNPNSIFNMKYRKGLIIGSLMMVFQQFSGINAVLSNLGTIIQNKFGPSLASSAQCFSCLICISVIDKIGRKKTWVISLFGAASSLLLLTVCFSMKLNSIISVLSLFAFLFFFCFGLGPIPWFLPSEFFPDNVRQTGLSILASLNWIFSFIVIYVYSILTNLFNETFAFIIFSLILICGGFFGMFVLEDKSPMECDVEHLEINSNDSLLEEEDYSFNE